MSKQDNPPPAGETSVRENDAMVAINEALILGSIRQHELTEAAEELNARLESEITERKQAEDKLRVSEVRFRRLFETASDGILLVDPASGRITDANPYMTQLSGCPHDQLVGKQLWKTGWFGNREAGRQLLVRLKESLEVHYEELPLDHSDGRRQIVEVTANRYRESGHSVIQINVRDITERKRAEAILRRNEVLFTALIDLAPVGVFVVDAGFRLQQVNPNAMHVFKGVHPLIGRDFAEILHILWPNLAADEVIGLFRHTLETGETYQSPEFSERRKDTGIEEVYEYQIQGVTLPDGESGLVSFFNNITERKNVEAARRTLAVLTASNVKLKKEIVRRKAIEVSLYQAQQEQLRLLEQSRKQEELLRDLSYRMLQVQEDERKRISRELHDVISQNLIGINVSIATLAKRDPSDSQGSFQRKIAKTQQIIEEAVDRIHQFARELRPALLDDLGLIPALHSLLEGFMKKTGIRASLSVFSGIENASGDIRTAFFRIAQEALANVARHSHASHVTVSITSLDSIIQMEIGDDGNGFDVAGASSTGGKNRLGLIGMKERIEMVGGCFQVESFPAQGTTIRVSISNLNP